MTERTIRGQAVQSIVFVVDMRRKRATSVAKARGVIAKLRRTPLLHNLTAIDNLSFLIFLFCSFVY